MRLVLLRAAQADIRRAALFYRRAGAHLGTIFSVVRSIPPGRVLTYGDVAARADLPRHARLVGYALNALPGHTAVPWHRVVNHRGGISTGRAWPGGELVQRSLLEAEGVEFDAGGRLPLARYRWMPDGDAAPSTRGL